MALKRMVLEIGMGTDIRGADSTKAAVRALRDALWRNSLSIADALGQPREAMNVEVIIGVPRPETVDKEAVLAVLPYGKRTIRVVEGRPGDPQRCGHGFDDDRACGGRRAARSSMTEWQR
jgi:uncharacterized protein (TIGR02058 family)